ncbi:MAG: hypothetical protein ACXV8O_01300 [Methylobacter sp.]
MFGLTKRKQRRKAEQQAAETLPALTGTIVRAAADIRVAEARTDAAELERLRTENAELRRLLSRYRDETPLGNQPHMIAHQADEALGRVPNAMFRRPPDGEPEQQEEF